MSSLFIKNPEKIRRWNIAGNFILAGAGIAVASPFLWVLFASFKSGSQLNNPTLIAFTPNLENWKIVLNSGIFQSALRSAAVGIITVSIAIIVGSMGAYSISRYKTGGSATRFGILAAQVLPPAVLVFPLLDLAYRLRVNGTLTSVIAAHLSLVLPVVTWFLIGFFDAAPKEVEEQALVDGLSRFQAFRKVVLPQVGPGIGASAIFGFVVSWNDLFYALILAPGNAATLPVRIAGFNTFRGVELGAMSAAILVSVIPVLIASFFIQRHLVRGISGGAVKF
ncbi:MAG: carbohydrate ABC transporter permease [Streptomycetaceae bacterium]|nr:MAG: carbohydrate ABC transporter permease [Streptomycetaceae bacterium]